MFIKRLFVVVVLMICVITSFAQTLVKRSAMLDSLKQQLSGNNQDSIKATSSLAISGFYVFDDNDSTFWYANRALQFNKQFNNPLIRIRAYEYIFIAQGLQRNDVAALKTLFVAQKLVDTYNDPFEKRNFLLMAGLLYNSLEDYRTSLHYFFASAPPTEDTVALNYYHATTCRIISEDYYKLSMLDSALVYANLVLKGLEKARTDSGTVVHRVFGNIYRRKGQLQPSLKELHTSLWLAKNADYLDVEVIKSQLGLAQTFYALHNIDSSLYYSNAVLHAPKINSFMEEKLQTLDLLKNIYANKSNIDSAYKYTSLALNLRDSIYNADKTKAVQRAELEQQMRTVAAENERKSYETRVKIYALIAALLVFLLIVFILIRSNRHRKKAYALLQQQKEEINNKNKELEIESALEKVRSRSLAMRQSDELKEVVKVVFEKLQDLGVLFDTASIDLFSEGTKDIHTYSCGKYGDELLINDFYIRYIDNPILKDIFEARESGADFFIKTYTKEEAISLLKHVMEYSEQSFKTNSEKAQMSSLDNYTPARAFCNHCSIVINNYSARQIDDSEKNILIRFAKVFEQAYTRFLDLQKAEAQAREAQIEAALEKVRSRSLAMHKSDELLDVVTVVFQELKKLGFIMTDAGIIIVVLTKDSKDVIHWAVSPDLISSPVALRLPYFDHPMNNDFFCAVENGIGFYSKVYTYEEKNSFHKHAYKYSDYKYLPDELKNWVLDQKEEGLTFGVEKSSAILFFSYTGKLLSETEARALRRFSAVFDQCYIRFLDLQKAEAQTREAQIEAALEKVRSRSMAMQKSEELREVIQLILDQLLGLNFLIDAATITVEFNESNDFRVWLAAPGQQYAARIDVPYLDHPIFNRALEAREKGETFYTLLLTKEEKNRYFDHFFKYAPITEERRKWLYSSAGWVLSAVLMNTVALTIYNYSTIPYSDEQNQALVRFGKAFEQTYTRFLDLQKAEAQAKEAQIEAALERVRSRSMAMQKSEELREVIQVIFDQLYSLHINLDTATFAVEIDETNDLRNWVASPLAQYASRIDLPYIDHPVFNRVVEAKEKGEDFLTFLLDKEEKDRFFDHYFKFAAVSEERKSYVYNGKSWAQSTVIMKNIALNVLNYSGIPYSDEENKTLVRFGKAFQQTYTRFLDLQKAEAAAKEAVKQASVDRVRAEIASMRTTNDLDRIIPLIWNELTILHIPFIRCGVFIVNEEAEQTQVYLSTPEGKAIAAFQLPFDSKGLNEEMLQHWRNNEIFKDHWDAATFLEWTHSLVEAGAIQPGEHYSNEKPPENLYLHFVPFMQGMLYVGNTAPLSADELSLIESLANAFSTAYARYEDFSKLEMAKQQIETTLTELKSTQSQLIQKEKMASLGELTAGIAHEIQNPLNFVNNFSEVNRELLVEIKEEIDKEDWEEVKLIVEDVISNEEKISHHGKRADSIVKGMLQHSKTSTGKRELTDINALVDESLRLSYHGLRAKDKAFNAQIKTHFDESIGKVNIVPQDMSRVLLNLFNNAFYAVTEKKKQLNGTFEPMVSVATGISNENIIVKVTDNGNGIPQSVINKIFQPFFTTKPSGQGTGLGLSLSYDIIKANGGEIKVESEEGEGTTFIVHL